MRDWQNRIIGSGVVPASDFLANPRNWRVHPKSQQSALKGALDEIGWIQEVIVNQRTGNLIDGHLRVTLALRQGEETPVPVKYVDLNEAEEALALATLDPIGAMAAADKEKLDALLRDVETGEAAVQEMLEGVAMRAGIIPPVDYEAEWQGMPEFEMTTDKFRSLIVHFETPEDVAAFVALIGQDITSSTKFIWYPARKKETVKNKVFISES